MMHRLGIVLVLLGVVPAKATTWYVRSDGGTRYSEEKPRGQCDGQTDAAYPGSGVNRHCAFGDIRYLWADGVYTNEIGLPKWGWVGESGDTYIIDCPQDCRVGYDGPNSGNYTVFDLSDAHYVDLACFNITDHSTCTKTSVNQCHTSYPLDDYTTSGIQWSNTTTNVSLTDIRVHGMAGNGLSGPTGDGVALERVVLARQRATGPLFLASSLKERRSCWQMTTTPFPFILRHDPF